MNEATGVIAIGWPQLLLATGFMVVTGGIALAMGLGLTRSLWIATARTYLQILALGLVLRWVFRIDSPWLVIGIVGFMTLMSAVTIVGRAPDAPEGVLARTFFAMSVTGLVVTFAVTGLIVRVEPWYLPRYVIPIAGMVLGNSMNGIALALERDRKSVV